MATPVEWLNEFQVNTGTADVGGISDPQIIGLSNGNFLVAWVEPGILGVGTTPGNDIIGKIFDAEGGLVRDSFRINTFGNADDEDDFDIAATNNGGFSMVYVDDDISNPNQEAILYQRFDDNGDQVAGTSKSIISNIVAGEVYSNPKIVVNNNDNSAFITYTDVNAGETEVHGVRVDAAGVVLTAEFDAAQNTTGNISTDAEIAINTNGELVTAYREDDSGTLGIELFITNTAGVQQHNTQVTSTASSDPHVATLTNGNIVVTWVQSSNVVYRVYNSDAVAQTGILDVDGVADNTNEPHIVGLPDGGFAIVWDNDTSNTLEGRRFNADGTTSATDTIFTIEPAAGAEINPNVGVTGDGRLLISWEEGDNVFSSIWDTRGTTINAADYAALPLNFIESDVITSAPTSSTVNGDGGPDTILGQDGDDILIGGGGADTIRGGGGADTIRGGFVQDDLFGEGGNDTFEIFNGEFADNISGGSGTDTLDVSARNDFALTIDLEAGTYTNQNAGNTISSVETIIGTQLADSITSTFGTQTLDGQGGDDIFIHGDGQFIDNIAGGGGIDTLDLSDVVGLTEGVNINLLGNSWTGLGGTRTLTSIETVIGTQLADSITSTFGTQTLNGEGGDDTFIHGNGQFIDNIDGGVGADTLDLSAVVGATQGVDVDLRNDTWTGLGGTRTLTGIEIVLGTQVDDTLRGDSGSTLFGNGGDDTFDFRGGDGFPDFDGGGGSDTADFSAFGGTNFVIDLNAGGYDFSATAPGGAFDGDLISTENYIGGGGADYVIASSADNAIDGGGGTGDTVDYGTAASAVTVDLGFAGGQATGGSGTDTLANIENAIGSNFSDNLTGTGIANQLSGGLGNDTLIGLGGDDQLSGGFSQDMLFGGDGNDTLNGGFGNDTLDGGADNDTAVYSGFGGGITVNLSTVGAQATGAAGIDTIVSIENVIGADFNDRLTGTAGAAGNNTIEGGLGSDRVFGLGGDDTLLGGGGNDNIQGGAGNDNITGGLGRDIMRGGTGDDIFFFNDIAESVVGGQRSRVDNFSFSGVDGNDTVDVSGIDANTGVVGDQAFSWLGTGAFTSTAGELRYFSAPGPRRIAEGDVNGDGVADFQIEFFNFNSVLIASDFVL